MLDTAAVEKIFWHVLDNPLNDEWVLLQVLSGF